MLANAKDSAILAVFSLLFNLAVVMLKLRRIAA
jgi:hypothetical protein